MARYVYFISCLAIIMLPIASFGHEGRTKNDNRFFSCERFISRADIEVPDLNSARWTFVKEVGENTEHPLIFYHDEQTPDILASVVVVHGVRSGIPFTQITWQVGDKIYKLLTYGEADEQIEEPICVSRVPRHEGRIFTIEAFLLLFEEKME